MKNFLTVCLITMVAAAAAFGQLFEDKAAVNVFQLKQNFTGPDTLKPYLNDRASARCG